MLPKPFSNYCIIPAAPFLIASIFYSYLPSPNARSAFGAKFRHKLDLCITRRAFRFGDLRRRSAFGAEFRVCRHGVWTRDTSNHAWLTRFDGLPGWNVGIRAHINFRSVIGLAGFFIYLLAHRLSFGLRVNRSHFFFVTRRATFALICLIVPANFGTNPFTAVWTLMKMLFTFAPVSL